MREIKFRVWQENIPLIKMWYWEAGKEEFNLSNALLSPKSVVMQFTGLKDKNGKEIYEGDIVRILSQYETDEPIDSKAIITFREGSFRTNFYDMILNDNVCKGIGNWSIEIIGNIYENPELLGEKNEQ